MKLAFDTDLAKTEGRGSVLAVPVIGWMLFLGISAMLRAQGVDWTWTILAAWAGAILLTVPVLLILATLGQRTEAPAVPAAPAPPDRARLDALIAAWDADAAQEQVEARAKDRRDVA